MKMRSPGSLVNYFRAAFRRKLVLLIPAVVLATATGIALWELPNLYQSSARLLVTSIKPDASDLSGWLNDLRQQVIDHEALEAIIAKRKPSGEPLEAVISKMRSHIVIEADSDRNHQPASVRISYCATDPVTARSVTDDLADHIIAQSLKESSSPSPGAELLGRRAAEIASQLHELEGKDQWLLTARGNAPAITPSQPQRGAHLPLAAVQAQEMSIESLKDQQYKINQQLADVDARITTQRQIVEQQKKGLTLRDNPTYALLIAKRAELQGQRDTLINRQELTDKHPRVLAINDQITAIDRQIEELRQQDGGLIRQSPEARELSALQSERNRLKIELEIAGRELARLSANSPLKALSQEYSPARRNPSRSQLLEKYLGLKRSYAELTNQMQEAEARRPGANSSSVGQLRIVEPANLPERPISPDRPLLISIAAAIGLVLGAVFVRFAESKRLNSLQDARDVECYTRLPLLAAIPRASSVSERRRAWWRAKFRLAFATAASVVATFALSKIFAASGIFALIISK